MANTTNLIKDIYPYVIQQISKEINKDLIERKLMIGEPEREKKFDGVSQDGKTIVSVFTSSGYSKSGKLPTGKINALYANCFMLNLTDAERKILAFTDPEFFEIIRKKASDEMV